MRECISRKNGRYAAVATALAFLVSARAATLPALYTARQAAAGHQEFDRHCASCHGFGLQGITGPALVGAAFAGPDDHYTLGQVFGSLVETTPAGAPASLTHRQYTDIMAYILARNRYPAGGTALSFSAALRSTAPFVSQAR